jgi:hypothetical protein
LIRLQGRDCQKQTRKQGRQSAMRKADPSPTLLRQASPRRRREFYPGWPLSQGVKKLDEFSDRPLGRDARTHAAPLSSAVTKVIRKSGSRGSRKWGSTSLSNAREPQFFQPSSAYKNKTQRSTGTPRRVSSYHNVSATWSLDFSRPRCFSINRRRAAGHVMLGTNCRSHRTLRRSDSQT